MYKFKFKLKHKLAASGKDKPKETQILKTQNTKLSFQIQGKKCSKESASGALEETIQSQTYE